MSLEKATNIVGNFLDFMKSVFAGETQKILIWIKIAQALTDVKNNLEYHVKILVV